MRRVREVVQRGARRRVNDNTDDASDQNVACKTRAAAAAHSRSDIYAARLVARLLCIGGEVAFATDLHRTR